MQRACHRGGGVTLETQAGFLSAKVCADAVTRRGEVAGSLIRFSVCCALVIVGSSAGAQRTRENAVTAAEDAFGISVGAETVGLYDASQVRGFSPLAAGNVRIDGLYFDQVWSLSSRLRRSTTIRVGLAAVNSPFPSPTGVVDYSFRRPGATATASAAVSVNSHLGVTGEVDAVVPISGERLSIGVGAALYRQAFHNGTDSINDVEALALRWSPRSNVELLPFWSRSFVSGLEASPIYIPAEASVPPPIPYGTYTGPSWARFRGTAINYGGIANCLSRRISIFASGSSGPSSTTSAASRTS